MENPFAFTYPLSVAFIECNCVIIIMCEWVCVVSAPREHTWWCTYSCVCVCVHAHQSNYFSSKKVHHTLYKCDIIRYNVKYVEIGAHFEIIESQFGKRKIPQQKNAATWLRWCRRRGEKLLHIAMHRTISTENVSLDSMLFYILSCVSRWSFLFRIYFRRVRCNCFHLISLHYANTLACMLCVGQTAFLAKVNKHRNQIFESWFFIQKHTVPVVMLFFSILV